MKKFIALLLFALMLTGCIFAYGCSENASNNGDGKTATNASPADIMAAIVAKYADIPAQKALYINGTVDGDDGYLDPEYANYLYTGNYDICSELDLLDSYAIRLPDGKSAFELHIMKVKDSSSIPAIQALLNSRIEMIKNSDIKLYDPEGYEKVMANAEVYTVDNYVYLLITPGNDSAKEAIQAAMYQ